MHASARRAYESGAKTSTSGRSLESAALFKAARQLEACRAEWGTPDAQARLADALRYNQRLWTFFQGELAASDCALPRELRVNLLRLSRFVDVRTYAMLAGATPEGLSALIEIDRQIAQGLAEPTDVTVRAA